MDIAAFKRELFAITYDLQKILHDTMTPICQEHGLTLQQMHVLVELMRTPGLTAGQLSDRAGILRTNFSPVCRKLENRGLIERQRSQTDRPVAAAACHRRRPRAVGQRRRRGAASLRQGVLGRAARDVRCDPRRFPGAQRLFGKAGALRMFGYVVPRLEGLDEAERERYHRAYCGLCRAIGERCGQHCRLALTYDLVFLALLLGSLYEPEEREGEGRCAPIR